MKETKVVVGLSAANDRDSIVVKRSDGEGVLHYVAWDLRDIQNVANVQRALRRGNLRKMIHCEVAERMRLRAKYGREHQYTGENGNSRNPYHTRLNAGRIEMDCAKRAGR